MVTADALVLAAGAGTSDVAALISPELASAVPIVPVEGSMYSTAVAAPCSDEATPRLRTLVAGIESELAWANAPATVPPQLTHAPAGQTTTAADSNTTLRVTRHFYGKSTADGRFLFGGDRRLSCDCGDRTPLLDELDSVHCHARELLASKAVDHLAISQRWAASMPFTPDGVPLIGRIEHPSLSQSSRLKGGVSGLFVVSGLGASGFMKVSHVRMIHTRG